MLFVTVQAVDLILQKTNNENLQMKKVSIAPIIIITSIFHGFVLYYFEYGLNENIKDLYLKNTANQNNLTILEKTFYLFTSTFQFCFPGFYNNYYKPIEKESLLYKTIILFLYAIIRPFLFLLPHLYFSVIIYSLTTSARNKLFKIVDNFKLKVFLSFLLYMLAHHGFLFIIELIIKRNIVNGQEITIVSLERLTGDIIPGHFLFLDLFVQDSKVFFGASWKKKFFEVIFTMINLFKYYYLIEIFSFEYYKKKVIINNKYNPLEIRIKSKDQKEKDIIFEV